MLTGLILLVQADLIRLDLNEYERVLDSIEQTIEDKEVLRVEVDEDK